MIPDVIKIADNNMDDTFQQCWLAATRPRYIYETDNRKTIDNVLISKACEDIEKTLCTSEENHNFEISFRTWANLVFGMVRIFQQQVNNLFENTKYLRTSYELGLKLVSFKSSRQVVCRNRKRKLSQGKKCIESIELSSKTLLEIHRVLELTDEEQKLLNSSDCQVQSVENITLPEPSIRTETHLARDEIFDDCIDLEIMQQEDLDSFLAIFPDVSSSLEKHRDTDVDNDAINNAEIPSKRRRCSDTEKLAGPVFLKPFVDANGNYSATDLNEHTFHNGIIAISTPKSKKPQSRFGLSCPTNRIATSPIPSESFIDFPSSPSASPQIYSSSELQCWNYYNFDDTQEFIIPPNVMDTMTNKVPPQPSKIHKERKLKNGLKLKIDSIHKISNERLCKQFQNPQTFRTSRPRDDCVSLVELKRVKCETLMSTPCYTTLPPKLSKMFKERLRKPRVTRDSNIINLILDLPCKAIETDNVNINLRSRQKKRKFSGINEDKENECSLNCTGYNTLASKRQKICEPSDENEDRQVGLAQHFRNDGPNPNDGNNVPIPNLGNDGRVPNLKNGGPFLNLGNGARIPNLENDIPMGLGSVDPIPNLENDRHLTNTRNDATVAPTSQELTREEKINEIWKILEKCWSENLCAINMTTICGKTQSRKDAAFAFMTLLEFNAIGRIEIIKDLHTQEIIHIKQRQLHRQKA